MKNVLFTVVLSLALYTVNQAQDRGLEIAKEAEKADLGFKSSASNLKMVLKNKNGQVSERALEVRTLELVEDGDKSLIVFSSPKDVKGTSTLTFTHKNGPDDQWLYLPSIKRVKRISSNNKSGPFVGSEFAYEDLSSQEVEKYTYKFLKEENNHLVVEQYPVDPKSGYTRRVVTYNKDAGFRIETIAFYDRKNALLKTLTYGGYKLYKKKFWRAAKLNMVNHQSKKETVLEFLNYDFDVNLTDDDFTQNALRRN
ncbi:outer membrane lipoprotein-sorting protein [Aestuariivivens sediminicola]|uniref:outer membrane lipoprotein-sorting protein n=1 Tax=Aestuariivivens sediminicola TaxID=2913560 RepID=UPI001F58CDDE|nr:outer membrane lipoprotein-sorting protein [Aestuariivivens sediminicola]